MVESLAEVLVPPPGTQETSGFSGIPTSVDIFRYLDARGIGYERMDHPAVFTCDEAERVLPLLPAASRTKNVFLRDRKGRRHFLVVVGYGKSIDLGALSALLGADRLTLGSPRRLQECLGVDPGSVTLLGLVNDAQHQVEVVLDTEVAGADVLACHPLINTSTLLIPRAGLQCFLQSTGHAMRVEHVPTRKL